MKNKSYLTLFMAYCFVVIAITGIMMYLLRHSNTTSAIHTTLGLLFLAFVGFHVKNNWSSLKAYSIKRKKATISKAFVVVLLAGLAVTAAIYANLAPFRSIYDWGNQIRASQDKAEGDGEIRYQLISTNAQINGREIEVEITKGPKDYYTVMAIWVEDAKGNYVETLFATDRIAKGLFKQEVDGEVKFISVRRPEAVPYWSHKRGIAENDGLFVPTPETALPDAITRPTPVSHFRLQAKMEKRDLQQFKVLFEVNRSFDWNEYYNEKAFPDDFIYSGNGYVGQPSLIYSTPLIDLNSPHKSYLMEVIGRGHHSGRDGRLYTNLSNITTALELTRRGLVIID